MDRGLGEPDKLGDVERDGERERLGEGGHHLGIRGSRVEEPLLVVGVDERVEPAPAGIAAASTDDQLSHGAPPDSRGARPGPGR